MKSDHVWPAIMIISKVTRYIFYNYRLLLRQTRDEGTFQLSLSCMKPYIETAQVLGRIFKHIPGCLHIFIIFWRVYSLTNMLRAIRCRPVPIFTSRLYCSETHRGKMWWSNQVWGVGRPSAGHNLMGMIANLCRYSHVSKLFCNQPPTPLTVPQTDWLGLDIRDVTQSQQWATCRT